MFEVWPREMAPGFYDTIIGACHAAGFEPKLDHQAAGNTVWGNIARGRGVGLINASLAEQLPRGVTLVDLAQPTSVLTIDAVWPFVSARASRASCRGVLRARVDGHRRCSVCLEAALSSPC